MDFALVVAAAGLASALTLFSGFGLGTLLLPVFALFMPVELAVAATALVHGANNLLKVALLGRDADRGLVVRFGLPAVVAAFAGVALLERLAGLPALVVYPLLGRQAVVTPVKLAMAVLMAVFAVFELHPSLRKLQIASRYLTVGGLLSGFFGGLSGHQGALRSAFLTKLGLSPQAFVATGAVIGLLVDLVRITGYGALLFGSRLGELARSREGGLVAAGVLAAFAGVVGARRLLNGVTMLAVQRVTGTMLLVVAGLLGLGLI